MKRRAVVQSGKIIHIGTWDEVIRYIDHETMVLVERKNPMPEEAVEGEFDIEEIGGQFFLASDYGRRRAAEYPSIEDQLDALWKGGEEMKAMRDRIFSIKEKFPKS
jgi:hypothetical protein